MKQKRHTTKPKPYDTAVTPEVNQLGCRLASVIQPMSQRAFSDIWGMSPVSVGRYIRGQQSPRIGDLMTFAQLTDTDLLWLIAGEHYAQQRWLQSNQCVELCLDDAMSPTLSINTPVVLEKLTPDSHLPNGIYCLESSQGRIFRRLQWDEEKQGFWLLCDNERFKPQLCQSPQVVGKAISALSPIT